MKTVRQHFEGLLESERVHKEAHLLYNIMEAQRAVQELKSLESQIDMAGPASGLFTDEDREYIAKFKAWMAQ